MKASATFSHRVTQSTLKLRTENFHAKCIALHLEADKGRDSKFTVVIKEVHTSESMIFRAVGTQNFSVTSLLAFKRKLH